MRERVGEVQEFGGEIPRRTAQLALQHACFAPFSFRVRQAVAEIRYPRVDCRIALRKPPEQMLQLTRYLMQMGVEKAK